MEKFVDYQILFNLAVGIAAFFGGYILQSISASIRCLDDHVQSMPMLYVNREDYKADIAEIKGMLTHIFDKLDQKADK